MGMLLLPVLAAVSISFSASAQQTNPLSGVNPSTLQQLQQQLGQRNPLAGLPGQAVPPEPNIVMQPDTPGVGPASPPSRLEQIMSARAGTPLRQFGYDQLGIGRTVTMPQTGAVQDDYVLGPGDEIVVSLRGQESSEHRVLVDRNGQVVLPRLSPISATGRSLSSFRQEVEAAVRNTYVAGTAFVSVGRVRQISVLVAGEVNNPGQRLVTGLSSVVDALLLSGGIRKSGSLRNIRIQRGGRVLVVDLYSVLTARGGPTAMRLADGDRILVPLLGPTVAISGLVRQPGIFELAARQTSISVPNLLQLAGGQEVRGLYRLSVLRIDADGRTNFVTVTEQSGAVRDSEILFVQLGADQVINQATLSGGTGLAGVYAIATGTTLSDVLRAPGALGSNPYTLFGLIVRRDRQTLMRTLLPFTPVAVINGRENVQLQGEDTVKLFQASEMRLLDFVLRSYLQTLAEHNAALRDPLSGSEGTAATRAAVAREDIKQLSAVQSYITNVPAEVQRRTIISLLEEPVPGSSRARQRDEQRRQDDLQARAGQAAAAVPATQAGMPGYQPGVAIAPALPYQQGQVQNPNAQFRNEPPARNFIASPEDTENYAANREAETFGQVIRQLDVDPLILVNFLVDHRARLEGAVRGPGDYLIGPNVSLQDVVVAAGGTVNWSDESGVELITTVLDRESGRSATQRQTLPLRSGTLASYIVRPRDQLRFAQIFSNTGVGSVTVQGEVRNPGTFSILRGDRLSDVLSRAGGLTNTAYASGTVFLRQSAARLEHESYLRAAREVEEQLVVAMTRSGTGRLDPGTFASMQIFVQELRNQKPVGRIAIIADPGVLATRPELDPLLEADDVIYIPQRPSTISVLGQVMQPGNFPYLAGESVQAYIDRAGGYSRTADSSETFIVLPDGSARRVEKSWFRFEASTLPPGSTIVVPRDIAPFDLRQTLIDVTQIMSQLAVSIASVAVISKQ
jgi:protein involved in polysaccharide export with SLBB domain